MIRYTTNGTDPTASSTQYTAPIPTSLSTTYKAKAFASGFLDSAIATGAYQIGDFVINTGVFSNVAVTTQTGTFTWSFRATSSQINNDAVMALADHTVAAYPDMAVIARFGPVGNIDAFNGTTGVYASVNPFPYVANQAYDFVVTVNVPAHTYSMTVVQAGGSTPTTIANNYAFRSTQSGVTDLDVFAGYSSSGPVTVSNMVFAPVAVPGISVTARSINPAGTQLTMTFNSQPAFGVGGQGGFTVSASGGTAIATAPTVGANAITWTLSRTIGRGESISTTYVQPGNGIEAATGGADLASFAGQTVLNNSTIDLSAPTPNPSTFGIAPTALTSSTITMTATTSTDAFTRSGAILLQRSERQRRGKRFGLAILRDLYGRRARRRHAIPLPGAGERFRSPAQRDHLLTGIQRDHQECGRGATGAALQHGASQYRDAVKNTFATEMEIRMRGVEARGEAAILRVNMVLSEIMARLAKLEAKVNSKSK